MSISRIRRSIVSLLIALPLAVAIVSPAYAQGASYYVAQADVSAPAGDGTQGNPFRGIAQAMARAASGDTLILTEDVQHTETVAGAGFTFDKDVTIQGGSHRLTFRGTDVFLSAPVAFNSLTLNIIPNGGEQPTIWAQGNDVSFTDVNTKINDAQRDLRPALYTGNKTGSSVGSSTVTISGGDSETRFARIVAGDATAGSALASAVTISSEFASVDEGITSATASELTVTSKSRNVTRFTGSADNTNETVIFDGLRASVALTDIDDVTVRNGSEITVDDSVSSIPGTVTVEDGSTLVLTDANTVNIGTLTGNGTVTLSATGTLNVELADGPTLISAVAWDDAQKNALLAREFFTAAAVGTQEPRVVVTQGGTETAVARNAEGKWIGTATTEPEPEAIRFTVPAPVTVPDDQSITPEYVYSLLIPPAGVTVGPVPSLPNSKANTISVGGKYRGYLYVNTANLPAASQRGQFEIVVSVVDEVTGEKTYPTLTLIKPRPTQPADETVATDWADATGEDALNCTDRQVKQIRTVTTTSYTWSDDQGAWLPTATETEQTQWRDMTDDEIKACTTKPADQVESSDWEDGIDPSDWNYQSRLVTQYRTVTTTPYVWDSTSHSYVLNDQAAIAVQESRTRPMTTEEIKAGTPKPADVVSYGEWVDGEASCADSTVEQTRTVTTTSHVWSDDQASWVLSTEPTVSTETQTRAMTAEEVRGCQPTPPDPTDPTDPQVTPETPETPTDRPTPNEPDSGQSTGQTTPGSTTSGKTTPGKTVTGEPSLTAGHRTEQAATRPQRPEAAQSSQAGELPKTGAETIGLAFVGLLAILAGVAARSARRFVR